MVSSPSFWKFDAGSRLPFLGETRVKCYETPARSLFLVPLRESNDDDDRDDDR